jgi:NAD(P)-dependent dehydrogenase (short-subunit alcohol dehydrogenase family)
MPLAIITGASRGLGLALARELARDGWRLVIDARGAEDLERAAGELGRLGDVVAIAGDVSDAAHQQALVAAAGDRIDLLVNNASALGPSWTATRSTSSSASTGSTCWRPWRSSSSRSRAFETAAASST